MTVLVGTVLFLGFVCYLLEYRLIKEISLRKKAERELDEFRGKYNELTSNDWINTYLDYRNSRIKEKNEGN